MFTCGLLCWDLYLCIFVESLLKFSCVAFISENIITIVLLRSCISLLSVVLLWQEQDGSIYGVLINVPIREQSFFLFFFLFSFFLFFLLQI